jgi:hypothetical protein
MGPVFVSFRGIEVVDSEELETVSFEAECYII